jgi:broad specificity phosphatase PhoE
VRLFVVRHTHAGSRSRWSGDDRLRPLSPKGRRHAAAVAARLDGAGIARLVSSPLARCVETLEPLAERAGLTVEHDDRLAEGSGADAALALADELRRSGTAAAVCSHGDVIPELLWKLKANGTAFHHEITWPKGSVWVVSSNGDRWAEAHYLAVPKE